jgi:hypothetical protein
VRVIPDTIKAERAFVVVVQVSVNRIWMSSYFKGIKRVRIYHHKNLTFRVFRNLEDLSAPNSNRAPPIPTPYIAKESSRSQSPEWCADNIICFIVLWKRAKLAQASKNVK